MGDETGQWLVAECAREDLSHIGAEGANMKIAVTSGSGKLGRTVVALLSQTGHAVVTLDETLLHAARRAGIRNIVYASSETVLGLPFDQPPPYIPVDEEYPAPRRACTRL
jgi:nucleoside-diphosphate-sugar epimerase